MRKDAVTFKVDLHKLKTCIAMLKDQLLIAKFVGTKPSIQALRGEP